MERHRLRTHERKCSITAASGAVVRKLAREGHWQSRMTRPACSPQQRIGAVECSLRKAEVQTLCAVGHRQRRRQRSLFTSESGRPSLPRPSCCHTREVPWLSRSFGTFGVAAPSSRSGVGPVCGTCNAAPPRCEASRSTERRRAVRVSSLFRSTLSGCARPSQSPLLPPPGL